MTGETPHHIWTDLNTIIVHEDESQRIDLNKEHILNPSGTH